MRKHKEVFTNIYDKNIWSNGSGTGSKYSYCKRYIENIQKYMEENNIENVVDLGCGDWQFSMHMDWSKVHYVGVDIVQSVIDENIAQHTSPPNVVFTCKDISDTSSIEFLMDKPDQLILIKDVLMHWSDEEIVPWMNWLTSLPNKHIIITNNWKYYRKPENNNNPRSIDNRYSWAPLDSQKQPLSRYGFEVLFNYRHKQASILTGENNDR